MASWPVTVILANMESSHVGLFPFNNQLRQLIRTGSKPALPYYDLSSTVSRWLFGTAQRREYRVPEGGQLACGELVGLVCHQVEVFHARCFCLLNPLGTVFWRPD